MPTASEVAASTGGPLGNVQQTWPLLVASLQKFGIDSPNVEVATAATIARESPSWLPVTEKYNGDPLTYFEGKYGYQTSVGQRLGNIQYGDGYNYRGRGFIQLTGRANYRTVGQRIGIDLENYPDQALAPTTAADVLAAFFADHGVATAAEQQDWASVQTIVNGGYNGYQSTFLPSLNGLLATAQDYLNQAGQTIANVNTALGDQSGTTLAVLVIGGLALLLMTGRRV